MQETIPANQTKSELLPASAPAPKLPSDDYPNWHAPHVPVWERVLAPMLASDKPLSVLEVGSHAGHSAAWIAEHMLSDSGRLYCIDTWPDAAIRRAFEDRIVATGAGQQVERHTGRSCEVLPELVDTHGLGFFDFIYVDGSHAAPDVIFDSVMGLEMLKVGGVLIWDDYVWRGGYGVDAPRIAIDAVLAINRRRLRVLHKRTQVAVEKLS